jgi:hypothetical protein
MDRDLGKRPHWSTRWWILAGAGAFSLAWTVLFPRIIGLVLIVVFVLLMVIPRVRSTRYFGFCSLLLAMLAAWSPLDLTFTSVPGGPKILACCPGRIPYRDYQGTLAKARLGECAFCSDVMGPNGTPRWYVVW